MLADMGSIPVSAFLFVRYTRFMSLKLRPLTGSQIHNYLDALADLRIQVFREWPYLYAGDRDYETRYLKAFAEAEGALLVAAFAGETLVGASTALPLQHEHEELREPFEDAGEALPPAESWYYLAESVLLPDYRGQGAGRRFFEAREAYAKELGFEHTCFAAVQRDPGDPRRPEDYRELDPFWRRLGYTPHDDLVAYLAWREVGEEESAKPLRFWLKDPSSSALE